MLMAGLGGRAAFGGCWCKIFAIPIANAGAILAKAAPGMRFGLENCRPAYSSDPSPNGTGGLKLVKINVRA